MATHVYRNLHKHAWSIRRDGRVVGHASECALADVRIHVGEAARARVASGAHRTVHAWCVGHLVDPASRDWSRAVPITYRPRERATFYRRDTNAPVSRAEAVLFTADRGALAINPE